MYLSTACRRVFLNIGLVTVLLAFSRGEGNEFNLVDLSVDKSPADNFPPLPPSYGKIREEVDVPLPMDIMDEQTNNNKLKTCANNLQYSNLETSKANISVARFAGDKSGSSGSSIEKKSYYGQESAIEQTNRDPATNLDNNLRIRRSILDDYETGCGLTKSCFKQQNNLFTYLMMTSQDGDQYLNIQLQSAPNRDWVAIGFGLSSYMTEASVVECMRDISSGDIIVQNSYNDPYYNNVVIDSRGLNVTEAGIVDGVLKCTFTRPAVFGGTMADSRLYNLTQPYYLMLASGQVSSNTGNKLQHPYPPPVASSSPVNLSGNELSDDYSYPGSFCHVCALKAHGCLMIAAWVFLTGVGILLPRYFKPLLGERKFFSTPFWFFVHRILMLLNLFATAAGFIVVFVENNGKYSSFQPGSPTYFYAHAPLGIIVMILVVLNPVISIFRCAPTDARRPIFNWFHFAIGMLAQILGVIDIFFGLKIAQDWGIINGISFWLMVAFTAFHVAIELLLLLFKFIAHIKGQQRRIADVGDHHKKEKQEHSKIQEIFNNALLVFYVVVVASLTVGMLVLVGS